MRETTQHIDSFNTRLGLIDLTLSMVQNNEKVRLDKKGNTTYLETKAHRIEVIGFQDVKDWLIDTDFSIAEFKGWIIRITKLDELKESLTFKCYMDRNSEKVESEVDCGEHLHALWIENENDVVSIGTEDGEVMKSRALANDWMPYRFKDLLGYHKNDELSITDILDYGFQTTIPDLFKGEKVYFHYLVASNDKKKSKDYPDEDDISTNLAVDYPKRTLIDKLKIEE